MSYRSLTILIVLMAVIMAGMFEPLSAGQGQRIPSVGSPTVRRSGANAAGDSTSVIAGQALNSDRTPLAFARVRLRNLDSGAVIEKTASDHLGEFSFLVVSRGNYVAELFDDTDRVVAVGEALTVEPGQTVGTLILLPARLPSFGALFGNSAGAIMSAAAGAGITAVTATGQPLSPEQ
ncbi:MAG: carboxypeptidase regulatory-like domain-containing protein [Planctomycetes bacterium]|nr:carboxypeptidase regulatory-like domain-containing protein [Planctomycetota bacterium]